MFRRVVEGLHQDSYPSDDNIPVRLVVAKACEDRLDSSKPCDSHELSIIELDNLRMTDSTKWLLPGVILDMKSTGLMVILMVDKGDGQGSNELLTRCKKQMCKTTTLRRVLSFYKLVDDEVFFMFQIPTENVFIKDVSMSWSLHEGMLLLITDCDSIIEVPLYWTKRQNNLAFLSTTYRTKAQGIALGPYRDFYIFRGGVLVRYTNVPLQSKVNLTVRKFEYTDVD